jgi:hypothetical protein
MAFVSVTRLRVRSIFFLPPFLVYALRSSRQAQRSTGFVGGRLLGDVRKVFWTLTVWTAAKAMEAYRTSGVHLAAMPRLLDWCDEASVTHWTQDSDAVPGWDEAYQRILKEGRSSKVNHPSAAHRAHEIAAPRPGRLANDLRPAHRSA